MSRGRSDDGVATAGKSWPAQDRLAWARATNRQVADFLDDEPRMAAWAPGTIANTRNTVGQFLRWAQTEGLMEVNIRLADIVTPISLLNWINCQRHRVKLGTIERKLVLIHAVLQALAADRDWEWIKRIIRRLSLHARREPRPMHPIVHAAQLYATGLQIMRDSWGSDREPNLSLYRSGLVIALLAAAPMRIGNLAGLRIGQHLCKNGTQWTIHLDAAETKTRRADTWPITAQFTPYLDRYLIVIRPMLRQRAKPSLDTGHLWIGDSGRPIGDQVLRRIIATLTRDHLGVRINPHTFRHCAATTFALERPHDALQSAALLGHASPETTERHYIIQQRQLVQHDYLGILAERRR